MPQREASTEAGAYRRVSIFPVRKPANGGRRKKAKPTSEAQEKLNQKNRQYRFFDLVHANFTDEDYYLTLTYREECMPDCAERAATEIRNFFRRVKTKCKKQAFPPPKYLYVTERGSRSRRIHHHVFLQCGLSRDEIEKLWGKGYANSRRLEFGENGVEGLVRYTLKGGACRASAVYDQDANDEKNGYRTYSGSKNLTQPKKYQNDYRIRAKDLAYMDAHPDDLGFARKLYPGWIVTRIEPTSSSVIGSVDCSPVPRAHFITLFMFRDQGKDKQNRKKNESSRK